MTVFAFICLGFLFFMAGLFAAIYISSLDNDREQSPLFFALTTFLILGGVALSFYVKNQIKKGPIEFDKTAVVDTLYHNRGGVRDTTYVLNPEITNENQ